MSRRRTHQTTVPGELPRGPVDDIVWLVLFWVLSRIVMLCLWQALCGFIRNDVNYYAMSVAGRPVPVLSDLTGVLEEYPAPLVWLLQLLEAPSGGSVDLYVLLFGLLIAVADGACCLALRRRESALAAWVWAICGALLGPLLWFRLDIAPALCVLGALHWMRRRPALSGVLLALGAGFKLWPALLILPMLGRSRAARHRGAGFVVTGSALVLVSLLTSGLARTCSPRARTADRVGVGHAPHARPRSRRHGRERRLQRVQGLRGLLPRRGRLADRGGRLDARAHRTDPGAVNPDRPLQRRMGDIP